MMDADTVSRDDVRLHCGRGSMVESYRRPSMKMKLNPDLAAETKALVALAFRNGPIEDLHAGKPCAAGKRSLISLTMR
jgi:hypothetical protein